MRLFLPLSSFLESALKVNRCTLTHNNLSCSCSAFYYLSFAGNVEHVGFGHLDEYSASWSLILQLSWFHYSYCGDHFSNFLIVTARLSYLQLNILNQDDIMHLRKPAKLSCTNGDTGFVLKTIFGICDLFLRPVRIELSWVTFNCIFNTLTCILLDTL